MASRLNLFRVAAVRCAAELQMSRGPLNILLWCSHRPVDTGVTCLAALLYAAHSVKEHIFVTRDDMHDTTSFSRFMLIWQAQAPAL